MNRLDWISLGLGVTLAFTGLVALTAIAILGLTAIL